MNNQISEKIKAKAQELLEYAKKFIHTWTQVSTWKDVIIPENPSEHPRLIRFFIFTMLSFFVVIGLTFIVSFSIARIAIPTVRVPAVTNMDIEKAINILQSDKLTAHFEMIYNKDIPKYQVISQYPKQGSSVREGRSVNIIISLGADNYIVPELTGTTREKAVEILDRERIPYTIQVVAAGEDALNEVIAMDTPAGKTMPRDHIIALTVTDDILTDQYRMNDFVRQPLEFAANTLFNNRITPIIVTTNVESLSDDGIILAQNIEAGEILQKNSSAILTVGSYPYNEGERENLKWRFFSFYIPRVNSDYVSELITNEDGTIEEFTSGEQPTAKFYKAVFEDEIGRSRTIYERMGAEGSSFNRVFKAYGKATVYVYADDEVIGKQNY